MNAEKELSKIGVFKTFNYKLEYRDRTVLVIVGDETLSVSIEDEEFPSQIENLIALYLEKMDRRLPYLQVFIARLERLLLLSA